jgi:hypothetical protein
MHKTIPFLEELSLKMEDKLNFIQSLLNDNSYSSKSYFSVKSLHPEDNIPKRDLLEFNRVQQRFATNESSLEQFKEYYTDALQEMSELQKKKLEGSKTDDNGVPILDAIKEKDNQIIGIKQTIERIGNEISKDKENTDVKINQYKACTNNSCGIKNYNPNLKWNKFDSTKAWGHTFLEHGSKRPLSQLADRAKNPKINTNQGRWDNNNAAASFLQELRKDMEYFPPKHKYKPQPLPEGVTGKIVRPNGTVADADGFVAVPNVGGGYTTAYPVIISEVK